MNAFEDIIALYLEEVGYWVKKSIKLEITKQDKVDIGSPSMPRPEIDLVALNIKDNTLFLVEAKSYLDSPGVRFIDVTGQNPNGAERYKLFTNQIFQDIVTRQIQNDYFNTGLINKQTQIKYMLAAGKVYSNDTNRIESYFQNKGWVFISPKKIKDKLKSLSEKAWEDNIVTMTAKIILRD